MYFSQVTWPLGVWRMVGRATQFIAYRLLLFATRWRARLPGELMFFFSDTAISAYRFCYVTSESFCWQVFLFINIDGAQTCCSWPKGSVWLYLHCYIWEDCFTHKASSHLICGSEIYLFTFWLGVYTKPTKVLITILQAVTTTTKYTIQRVIKDQSQLGLVDSGSDSGRVPGLIPDSDKNFVFRNTLVDFGKKEAHPWSYLLYGARGCKQKVS